MLKKFITFFCKKEYNHNVEELKVCDLHNDALLKLSPQKLLRYLDAVDTVLLSVWTTELTNPMKTIKRKQQLLENVKNAKLHIEDAWFLTPQNIADFIALKPYSVGLTWNNKNSLATGAKAAGGLTKWGRIVIGKLEDAGIQIDTAHLNRQSFYEFAKITKRPILCTHTCFDKINRHLRNLTAAQIRTIIKSNGIIGLTFVPEFLTKNTTYCSYNDVINHILYYLKIDPQGRYLAIGTDFFGTDQLPKGIRSYKNFTALFREAQKKNISKEIIDRIFYKNAKAFLARTSPI
jgi:membrane dipeptidase